MEGNPNNFRHNVLKVSKQILVGQRIGFVQKTCQQVFSIAAMEGYFGKVTCNRAKAEELY